MAQAQKRNTSFFARTVRSLRGMAVKAYLLSLPERLVRSTLGLGAGAARELGEVAIPRGVRRSQLYRNLVDTTLRYLIEQVGGAEGVYPPAIHVTRTS